MIDKNSKVAQKAKERLIEDIDELRKKRKRLLAAFDIYKTNVLYGILEDPGETQRELIVAWYNGLLDLDPDCFEEGSIPEPVKRYL